MYVSVVFFLSPFARNFAPSLPRLLFASSRWVMLLLSPIAFPNGSTLVGGNFVSESTKAFSVFVLDTYSAIPAAPEHPIDTPVQKKMNEVTFVTAALCCCLLPFRESFVRDVDSRYFASDLIPSPVRYFWSSRESVCT